MNSLGDLYYADITLMPTPVKKTRKVWLKGKYLISPFYSRKLYFKAKKEI